MTYSIKDQIAVLIKLQAVDNETLNLQTALNSVDSQLDVLNRGLLEFEQACQNRKEELNALRKTYRDRDREVQGFRNQIAKSQEKTRSVKTNKEYQSLLKEIDDLKKKISFIEDEMLEILEQIESVEQDTHNQLKELDILKTDVNEKKAAIENEVVVKQESLQALQNERTSVESQLTPEILKRFGNVKAKVGDIAISAVKKAVCQGCHVNIPPQLCNELQRYDTLVQCPNCQRIIYYHDNKRRSE